MDWLRLIRLLTQYVAPGLILIVLVAETVGYILSMPMPTTLTTVYNDVVVLVFSVLTTIMIGVCVWIVFLWDIDRLFFKLENKIDWQVGELAKKAAEPAQEDTLLGRAKELLSNAVGNFKGEAVASIAQSYWDDINAGGVLAFPRPDITAAVDHIDKSRHDLLAPLSKVVSRFLPLRSFPAAIVSRVIFRYIAPEIKVRLYRRLILRFLAQLGALFAVTALCFFITILAWSRVSGFVFNQAPSPASVFLYQIDLMLRGALFDFMEHTHRSISPITINQDATAFVYYTLMFRMFVAVYVMNSFFRVVGFVLRRWRALLR
jgi:hypothetical protein